MIVVMKPETTEEELQSAIAFIKDLGLDVHLSRGEQRTIIGAVGDVALLRNSNIITMPGVEQIVPILKPYKLVSREFQAEDTVIDFGDFTLGG